MKLIGGIILAFLLAVLSRANTADMYKKAYYDGCLDSAIKSDNLLEVTAFCEARLRAMNKHMGWL